MEYLDKATQLLEKGEAAKASVYLKKITPRQLPPFAQAEYYERLGSVFQYNGQFTKAQPIFQKAFSLYRKLREKQGQIDMCLRLGDVNRQTENFREAKGWYEKAQSLVGKSGKKSNAPIIYAIDAAMGKALCLRGVGRLRESARWFSDLISVYKNEKDWAGVAYSRWALGTTQRFLGNFRSAKKNLESSLKDYQKLKDPLGIAYARCGLGGTLRMMGLAKQSGMNYQKASKTFQKLKDEFGLAYSSCGQANAFRMQNKVRQSLPFFKKAIGHYRHLGLKGPLGYVLWSQAQQDMNLKKFSDARKKLSEAQKLFKSVKDERGLAYVHLGWGEFFRQSRPSKGADQFKKAYRLSKKQALIFEMIHAKRGFSLVNSSPLYAALGVSLKDFQKYQTLP